LAIEIKNLEVISALDLGGDQIAQFRELWPPTRMKLTTYDTIFAKLNESGQGSSSSRARIATLQRRIAADRQRLAAGENVNTAVNTRQHRRRCSAMTRRM
jgi:hypothetical protein